MPPTRPGRPSSFVLLPALLAAAVPFLLAAQPARAATTFVADVPLTDSPMGYAYDLPRAWTHQSLVANESVIDVFIGAKVDGAQTLVVVIAYDDDLGAGLAPYTTLLAERIQQARPLYGDAAYPPVAVEFGLTVSGIAASKVSALLPPRYPRVETRWNTPDEEMFSAVYTVVHNGQVWRFALYAAPAEGARTQEEATFEHLMASVEFT